MSEATDEVLSTRFMINSETGVERVDILGFHVDPISMDDAIAWVEAKRGSDRFHLLITADASGIVQAQDDPELGDLYKKASVVTPDGAGILWASKKFGSKIVNRVSGVDLVERLCAQSEKSGLTLYFLGAAPGVAQAAKEKLESKYPKCRILGVHDGFFGSKTDDEVAALVGEFNPDVLLVAMGIPRQEKFLWNTQNLTGAKVGIGIGGSFDVHSGQVKRAPKVFQALRLEWAWRLLLNPKKISKVRLLPIFARRVLSQKNENLYKNR